MFALVAIRGWERQSISAVATFEEDWRRARRPVFPVAFNGTFAEAGTIIVSGPGQKWRASR